MKKIFCFTVIISLLFNNSKAQSNNSITVIKGTVIGPGLQTITLTKCGLRSHLNYDPDIEIKIAKNKKFSASREINSASFYRIGDLYFGHTIFIEPKDTIEILLKPVPDFKKRTENGEFITKQYELVAKGAHYGNIIFFDELEKRIGLTIKYKFEQPLAYKAKCKNAFETGLNLLNQYKTKGIISENFYTYALEDLKARQVLWLCEMLSAKVIIFKESIIGDLKQNTFGDSVFAVNSDNYSTAGAVYNYYIANNYNPKNGFSNLTNEFSTILKNYTGLVKDRLMGWQIEDYIGKDAPSFDSCYQVFLSECINTRIKKEVISKVDAFVKPPDNLIKIGLKELFEITKVKDFKENKLAMSGLFKDSSINIIDCWATWCFPCRNQMPFIDEFQKKYENKLNVIYLSFDKDEIKWKSYLTKNNIKEKQFLIDNDFASEFSKYFDIQAIPRYILISKGGIKVLNTSMPLPGLQEEFEEELKKYLN